MLLRRLQQTGHRPIALMGGGTTKVGDPSGKDETRQLLTEETIRDNIARIGSTFANYLDFAGGAAPPAALMVNNADWLDGLEYIPLPARHRPAFHDQPDADLRFGEASAGARAPADLPGVSTTLILQAYDFMELARRQGCRLQMGGSDQWGNIVNGIELTRRMLGQEVYGLTAPLDHHRFRGQDGQDRGRRDLAGAPSVEPVGLLAVLAQHRGRRCRPVPEAVHRPAA